jgi:hypothetical protein
MVSGVLATAEPLLKNALISRLPMGAFFISIDGEKRLFPGHTTRMRNSGHAAAQ